MRLTGIMYVKTDLLNIIDNIRTSECEILQCTSKTAITSGIGDMVRVGGSLDFVSAGVLHGLQVVMSARARMSRANET